MPPARKMIYARCEVLICTQAFNRSAYMDIISFANVSQVFNYLHVISILNSEIVGAKHSNPGKTFLEKLSMTETTIRISRYSVISDMGLNH